ncbi:MAG: DUF3810 domain-containing protein [Saccharofermentanales bacterium]
MKNKKNDTMKNEKSEPIRHLTKLTMIWEIISKFSFIILILFVYSLQRIFALFPAVVEFVFSTKIYRWISAPISFVTSLIPVSLTEMLAYLSIPLFIVLIILIIRNIRKSANRKRTILKIAIKTGWVVAIAYLSFMLLLGFNYARLPLSESISIETVPRSRQDLEKVCYILLEKTNMTRVDCTETGGVMVLKDGTGSALKNAYKGYNVVSNIYPVLQGSARRAKGVIASHWWSYTGITGMYFPFFVEANVNTDVPDAFLPNTILHELAHTRGIAREDDASFVAFLTGINHPDNDFKYSSYLDAFIQATNSLYSVDRDAYDKLQGKVSDAVKRDLYANNRYWKQFEGPVQEVSTSVNNTYLQSNMQEDGIRSYGKVVDLLLGYYLS